MGREIYLVVAGDPVPDHGESTTAPLPFAFGFVPALAGATSNRPISAPEIFIPTIFIILSHFPPASSLRMTGEKSPDCGEVVSPCVSDTRLPNELDFHIVLRSRWRCSPYCRSCREWANHLNCWAHWALRRYIEAAWFCSVVQLFSATQLLKVSSTVSNVNLTFEYEVVP